MSSRAVALLLCPESATYVTAVESSIQRSESEPLVIPVIASDAGSLLGFPEGIQTVRDCDSELRNDSKSIVSWNDPTPGASVCVSTEDPTCQAAARLLAAHTRRRFHSVSDSRAWEAAIRELYELEGTFSVTLFVPGWTPDHSRCTPEWLRRTLTAMRSIRAQVGNRPWGIMTAPNAAVLSHLAAKALLEHAVAERYAACPGFVLTTDERVGPVPAYDAGASRLVHAFDRSTIDDRSVLRLPELAATFLAVASHGRSYCAVAGLLCGARDLRSLPESEVRSCVMGMDCADPSLFRIDPRRYDAPVLVLDCCSSANWGSPVWETGMPSLAYYALAGSPSALLVGDGLAHVLQDTAFDHVWALLTSSSLGDAAVRLNAVRPTAAAAFPYFVLGDPDIMSGQRRWQHWVNEPLLVKDRANGEQTYLCTLPKTSDRPVFERVCVPFAAESNDGQTIYVTGLEGKDVEVSAQYRYAEATELWFQRQPSERSLPLRLIQRPSPRLPHSVVESARRARDLVAPWSIAFEKCKPAVLAAAENVLALSRELQQFDGRVVSMEPKAIERTLAAGIDAFCRAQMRCCEALLEHKQGGLPPAYLWQTDNFRARTVEAPCECCGLSPTIERTYDAGPAPSRSWSECNRCDITTDRPCVPGYPTITLEAPSEVQFGRDAVVKLEIAGVSSELWCGAGFASMVHKNHGVVSEPATFELRCHATDVIQQSVTLSLREPPANAHLYRLVVAVLLNNYWHWSCRLVMVRR